MQTRVSLAAAVVLLPFVSRADPVSGDFDLEAIGRAGPTAEVAADRSWLYNDPTRVPGSGKAVAVTRLTYSGGDSLTRPFAGNVAAPGALLEAGGEVGIGRGWSAVVIGAQGEDAAGSSRTGAMLGVRYSLLPESVRATQAVVSGGVLRELQGRGGAWARAAFGHDEGRARLALSVHVERIFDPARDAVDVMVTAGASFRLVESIRAGLEYVGQDLEGMVDDDAEGGARHIVGPMLAATLWNERLTLAGGPAIALGAGQGRVLGRIALSCQF